MSAKGRILNIQHFCVDDGPGIRTTVFLKGCNLRCVWCHNPESHSFCNEIMFYPDKCTYCSDCAYVCPNNAHNIKDNYHGFDRTLCTTCGRCTQSCASGALTTAGREVSVNDIMNEILHDKVFYETSGGGVTISGGEPLAQYEFTKALLEACKEENISTCIETSAFCTKDVISSVAPFTDLFYIDWKLTDDLLHQKYTGVSNKQILKNLEYLNESNSRVVLRCPIIDNINNTKAHLDGIIAVSQRFSSIERIELEPYHPLGIHKALALGKEPKYKNNDFFEKKHIELIAEYLSKHTDTDVTISGKR